MAAISVVRQPVDRDIELLLWADLCRSRAVLEGGYPAQSCLRSRPNEGSSDSAFVIICTISGFPGKAGEIQR
jgi:hypothetical protein